MRKTSSKKLDLTAEHRQVLQETVITEDSPGTIVKDFNFLLHFLGKQGFPVTATHQLPIRALPEINSRLTHPLEQGLKRPQQKSYPNINGLFLLLRASGLTFVDETGKAPLLLVDEGMRRKWNGLNPAEQYGTLLEAWLLRGRQEIIGESGRGLLIPDHFGEWRDFFKRIPRKGLRVAGNKDVDYLLRFAPGWHNLGLLELFGLISVRSGSPVEGKGWNMEHIHRTVWGDALLALLDSEFFGDLRNIFELEDQNEVPYGVLQPILSSYWRDLRGTLTAPEPVFRKGAHIFKVSLEGMWCRIAIPADHDLDSLASAILGAIEFDEDHLYLFSYKNRFGASDSIHHPYVEEGPWTSEVSVGDLWLPEGHKMTFLYDFGDEWKFDVTLERIDRDMTLEEAVVLEIHGKPPKQYSTWDE
jgi:hypothetical protein